MQNYARKSEANSTAENLIFYPQIQRAFAFISETNDEFTEELIRICEIPAPPFKEEVRAAYIKHRFEELGLTNVHTDHEGNVIAERRGKAANPNLIDGSNAPHADGRVLALRGDTGPLLNGSDGGIAEVSSPSSGTHGTWTPRNGNLGTLEVHNAAYDPVSRIAFGGTQDNGTVRQSSTNAVTHSIVIGGDGAQVAVVRNPANANQSLRYMSSQYLGGGLGGFVKWTYSNTGSVTATAVPSFNVIGTGQNLYQNDSSIQFYGPIATNRGDGNRLYIGTRKIYESLDQGNNLTMLKDFGSGFTVRAIAASGYSGTTAKPEVLYVGANSQLWLRPDTGGALAQVNTYAGGTILDLAIQSTDWTHLVVASSSSILRSTSVGGMFSSLTGNLFSAHPNATSLLSVETLHVGTQDLYLAGTRDGVYLSSSDNLGVWSALGANLPDVVVADIDYEPETDTLLVATLGRGIWRIDNFSTIVVPEPSLFLLAGGLLFGANALRRRRAARGA